MSITQIDVGTPTNQFIFQDTVMGNAVDGVKASSALLLFVKVDNSLNISAPAYVKLFNLANNNVTLGVTPPDEIIYVPAGQVVTREYFTGAVVGVTFGTALSAACVTVGGTAGTVSPASAVAVNIVYV